MNITQRQLLQRARTKSQSLQGIWSSFMYQDPLSIIIRSEETGEVRSEYTLHSDGCSVTKPLTINY